MRPLIYSPRRGLFCVPMFLLPFLAFALGSGISGVTAEADTLLPVKASSDPVRILDGDTLELNGERIRLEGIDAPELAQSCLTADGRPWPCGRKAKQALTRLASAGGLTCRGHDKDDFGRRIATCYAGGLNINAELILSGHALAFRRYSVAYVREEQSAQQAKRGLWSGLFDKPWDYRAAKWTSADQTAPEGCPIKGNISSRGRIYHMPWSRSYARTRINEAAGERWFCTEAEAIAAGWRGSL
jgi:endonuclease YncB( thermonuclease family)